MKISNVAIAASARALPQNRLDSATQDAACGLPAGTLERVTGVQARYVCDTETQIDLAVQAAKGALAQAGVTAEAVDLVVFGASVPYQNIPATAPLIMQRLGMSDGQAAAFDVNSTCLSFLTAFETAAMKISAGQHHRALVISAELPSRALPWDSAPETAALFGDGAAAFVLHAAPGCAIKASTMRSYPSAFDGSALVSGGTRVSWRDDPAGFAEGAFFQMNGKSLFQITTRHFKGFTDALLDAAGWTKDDIDLVIPHQASPKALIHMARLLDIPIAKIIDISASHGNQVAASIPFAWDMARSAGRTPKGTKVLCLGTAAGVSFGGLAYEV